MGRLCRLFKFFCYKVRSSSRKGVAPQGGQLALSMRDLLGTNWFPTLPWSCIYVQMPWERGGGWSQRRRQWAPSRVQYCIGMVPFTPFLESEWWKSGFLMMKIWIWKVENTGLSCTGTQCCESGMLIPDPESWFSSNPDPGSNKNKKKWEGKRFFLPFLCL